ncbi:MAG: methyltransferase domain-containing protein [Lentisphaeraceae bacterium]|nr:methyltransferase domain-containing protein [Lentisphaeraceae bacterium]
MSINLEDHQTLSELFHMNNNALNTLYSIQKQGYKNIAIYGAGQHTKKISQALANSPINIVCIIDDSPDNKKLLHWNILSLSQSILEDIDAILFSSDSIENQLWEKRHLFESHDIQCFRLYEFSQKHLSPAVLVRVHEILISMHRKGHNKLAIYGAGQHTKQLSHILAFCQLEITTIIDDSAEVKNIFGLQSVLREKAKPEDFDFILLSSEKYEERLWENCQLFRQQGIECVRIYKQESITDFWTNHLVHNNDFNSKQESLATLEARNNQYPKFKELMSLYGSHKDQTVVDFGCGPGHDTTGFLEFSDAKKVIGVDISSTALTSAKKRLDLHQFPTHKYELILSSDDNPKLPIEDKTIDYIHSEGVLHHTSSPLENLKEFNRILKADGQCCIMVYNKDSIHYHLYAAYSLKMKNPAYQNMSLDEVFKRSTDTFYCPKAECYSAPEFIKLCEKAGFNAEFKGGYLSNLELKLMKQSLTEAINDSLLPSEHKRFLQEITLDHELLPIYNGLHCGIGGVYHLTKVK